MSDSIEIIAVVEGKTEKDFIDKLLAPYLAPKEIFMRATKATKKGEKGGDIRFSRLKIDICNHLKQRSDTFVTTFVDYYGTKEWPELKNVPPNSTPAQIAQRLNSAARSEIGADASERNPAKRFIPFMVIHEFESLLFSDSAILAEALEIKQTAVDRVLARCGSPEAINNSPQTAPSKRLEGWSARYAKTTTGIAIARKIGIDRMRKQCPLFNAWLTSLEDLRRNS